MGLPLRCDVHVDRKWLDPVSGLAPPHLSSLTEALQESTILLTDLSRLLKGAPALAIKATKVALNIPDVELEVMLNDIGEVARGLRVTRNEGSLGSQTGRRMRVSDQNHQQKYSLRRSCAPQPEVTQTPINLE